MRRLNTEVVITERMLQHINCIDEIAREFDLYGGIFTFSDASAEEKSYLLLSASPMNEEAYPQVIINEIKRNPDLFYPNEFAIELTSLNAIEALNEVADYCGDAGFLKMLYRSYGMKNLPHCIRYSELAGLKNWVRGAANENAPASFRNSCVKGLEVFFKKEKNLFNKPKRNLFRSGRLDEKASFIQKKFDYLKGNNASVRVNVLLQSSNRICKRTIKEKHLDSFQKHIELNYPEVLFATSKRKIAGADFIQFEEEKRGVSFEEFSYYEVFFRETDEFQIQETFNAIYENQEELELLVELCEFKNRQGQNAIKESIEYGSPIIPFEKLINSTSRVGKKTIEKCEINNFSRYLNNIYGGTFISLGDMEILDEGILERYRKCPQAPYFTLKPVTYAEFRERIDRHFAEEGFGCVNDIQPVYWEYYDVYYSIPEENKIASAYNNVYLNFAASNELDEIEKVGPLNRVDIPIDLVYQYVALAKYNSLPFYFDLDGLFSKPAFERVSVIYGEKDRPLMDYIIDEVVDRVLLESFDTYKEFEQLLACRA